MSPTETTPAPPTPAHSSAAATPAVKAVGPLPPPIVPLPPAGPPPTPAQPPAKADANAAVELAPAPLQGRIYQAIDIACPHQNFDFTNCGAAENEPCSWQQTGMEGTFHAERIANAAAASRGAGILPTQQQFDDAAEAGGLF